MSITHANVVAVADDGTSPVGSDEWNAAHTIDVTGVAVVGHRTGTVADRWYTGPVYNSTALGAISGNTNTLKAMPFVPSKAMTIDHLAINVTTLGAASLARVGIYTDDGNMYPASLLIAATEFDCSTTGVKSAAVSQALTGGTLYWLVSLFNNALASVRGMSSAGIPAILGYDNTLGTAGGFGWSVAQAYGALPSTFTAGGAVITTNMPAVFVRGT